MILKDCLQSWNPGGSGTPGVFTAQVKTGTNLLLTDTVGFIRKLPHDLVETFKSTLEETKYADFLVHVLDASSPEVLHHYQTTMAVLEELEVGLKPTITVFNKLDLCQDELFLLPFKQLDLKVVKISTKTGAGLPELLKTLEELLYDAYKPSLYKLPVSRYDLAAMMHRKGRELEELRRGWNQDYCFAACGCGKASGRVQDLKGCRRNPLSLLPEPILIPFPLKC